MADDEGAAGGGEEHARAQVDVRQHAQGLFEPGRELHRLKQHQVLQRAVGADGSAESPPGEERDYQRQDEEGGHGQRHGIAAVAEAERDILHGADGADATLFPEAKVEQ